MENLSRQQTTSIETLPKSLQQNTVLRLQTDKAATVAFIVKLLVDVAELYQVPNFGGSQSVKLAEWILDNYRNELIETVYECLKNPPSTGSKEWRLTPDTIRDWMEIKLEEVAERRERAWQNFKNKNQGAITEEEMTPISAETQKLVDDMVKSLKSTAPKRTIFLNRYNIGEECPNCKGSGRQTNELCNDCPCGYCEGKGAIGIVEIKAETEFDAKQEYERRFNVKAK